jgi:Flp pilus assembly protein TadD
MNDPSQLIAEGKQLCDAVWEDTSLWEENHSQAIQKFRSALSVDPKNTAALINLGAALSNIGKHKLALDTLLKADRIGSEDGTLYFNIGVAMVNLDAFRSRAKPYFEKAEKMESGNQTVQAYFDPHGY